MPLRVVIKLQLVAITICHHCQPPVLMQQRQQHAFGIDDALQLPVSVVMFSLIIAVEVGPADDNALFSQGQQLAGHIRIGLPDTLLIQGKAPGPTVRARQRCGSNVTRAPGDIARIIVPPVRRQAGLPGCRLQHLITVVVTNKPQPAGHAGQIHFTLVLVAGGAVDGIGAIGRTLRTTVFIRVQRIVDRYADITRPAISGWALNRSLAI